MLVARASLTGVEVQFQIGVTTRDIADRCNGLVGKRCAAEIGVNNDAGRIDRPTKTADPPLEQIGA